MTLGDYCLHITDGEHCTVQDDPAGEFYLLSNKNIIDGNILIDKNDRLINRETFEKINKRTLLDVNDVLISTVGTLGKTAVVKEPINYTFQRSVGILKPNPEKVDSYFLKYLLDTDYYQKILTDASAGAIQKCIFISTLKSLPINLPNIAIQQRTAKVLLELDRKIALNRQINQNLEALARQLYDYWFVQFDFPDANGKPYKSSGGKMVYNPILKREIPEGWEYVTANEITNVVTGKEDANFSTLDGKYPFFTCSRENLLCSKAAFSGKAILIAGNGDFNVKHYNGEFNAYQRTYVLIPNDEKYYGVLYFSATGKIDIFRKGANGSIVKFITKGDVEQIGVFNCKNENLYRFINNLILQIENNNAEILSLTKQRDELLPLLMNGQVNFDLLVYDIIFARK